MAKKKPTKKKAKATKAKTKTKRSRRGVSDLSPRSAKAVKGGATDTFAVIGVIKGESLDDVRKDPPIKAAFRR